MSGADREGVMTALLALLQTTGSFAFAGRRNRDPETIAAPGAPVLMLVEHSERYVRPAPGHPPRRTLSVRAIVYYDAGLDVNVVPSSIINPILDAIDEKLKPDSAGKCTLGGRVQSVEIDGEVVKAPGAISGKGIAILPIDIILP